jgi:hypothetical protein
MTNDWRNDLFKVIWLATYFAVSSRCAKDALETCERLASESMEMEWTEEEVRWYTVYEIWDELSNRLAALIDPLLESLGLTQDEVVVPFLKAIYCR